MKTLKLYLLNFVVFWLVIFGSCVLGALAIVARIADRMDRRAAWRFFHGR